MTADRRAATIQGLRDLADFIEAHPQIPLPFMPGFDVMFDDVDALRAAFHLTGKWDKKYLPTYAYYRKDFGPVGLELTIARDKVCRRVQTGTKRVEAVEAHDEPVWDWVCTEEPATPGQVEAAELMSAGGSA